MAFKLEETVGIALFNCAYSFRTAQRSLEAHLFDYIVSVFTEGSEGIGAVSYTHLDVYKRQVCKMFGQGSIYVTIVVVAAVFCYYVSLLRSCFYADGIVGY